MKIVFQITFIALFSSVIFIGALAALLYTAFQAGFYYMDALIDWMIEK